MRFGWSRRARSRTPELARPRRSEAYSSVHAIITALNEEIKSYLAKGEFKITDRDGAVHVYESESRPNVAVLEGGIGRENAQQATKQALQRFKPEFIVSAGFAGAVRSGYDAGHVFLCNTLMAMDGPPALWGSDTAHPTQSVDLELMEKIAETIDGTENVYARGACMTVSVFISGSGLKDWIGENFPVSVIDMESYWVSQTADEGGVPTVVARSVLDTAEQDLPSFVSGEAATADRRRWRRALSYLAKRPREVRQLLGLRRQAKVADEALSRFLVDLEAVQ